MTRNLLIRGMVAGILAAILATLFARALAEPQVDLAIAYEASHSAHEAHSMPGMPSAKEPELVSRGTQKGLGLLTALTGRNSVDVEGTDMVRSSRVVDPTSSAGHDHRATNGHGVGTEGIRPWQQSVSSAGRARPGG